LLVKVSELLEKMVPAAEQCRVAAQKLRARHPDDSVHQLAGRAVQAARRAAAVAGAATGAASNPITMVPVAFADMAAVLRIEATLIGVIAALLDPTWLSDGSLRADSIALLFPGAVSQALRQIGIRAGEQFSRKFLREQVGKDVLKVAMRLAARHLGAELTRKALIEKAVPLVGIGIGAGWNWLEVGAVARRAVRYFSGQPALPASSAKRIRSRVRARPKLASA
jgi:3-oxoacyl-[acyl-carrier-protein] synthase III